MLVLSDKGTSIRQIVRDLLLPGDVRQGHQLPLEWGKVGCGLGLGAGWEDGTWRGSLLPTHPVLSEGWLHAVTGSWGI